MLKILTTAMGLMIMMITQQRNDCLNLPDVGWGAVNDRFLNLNRF
ncbi:MAG: hypothetical protein AB1757_09670 [Acidobacteriota bacterium]